MLAKCAPLHDRYFIVGSCATRDAFDQNEKSRLAGYVARSSFGSAFASKPFPFSLGELDPDNVTTSAFQRRMIGHDLAKELVGMLRHTAPARPLIIVDFIDERFSLLECDGAFATYSLELMNVRCLERHPEFRVIRSCSEEHFELWAKGFAAFANLARELRLNVLVNRVFWAPRTESGKIFDGKWIDINNRYLERLYAHVAETTDFGFVTYDGIEFIGSSSHVWGEAPYHYRPDVYQRLIRTLGFGMTVDATALEIGA